MMNTDTGFSFLDLLDLPELQNEIVLHITRNGPAEAGRLAQALERDPAEVGEALAALIEEGRVRLLPDGQADVVMGRVKSRTTLPASSGTPCSPQAGPTRTKTSPSYTRPFPSCSSPGPV